ncbi:MAG: hypothetical protein GQ534_12570 [Candidatus Delongbacteria bacterium]|nr:hypothetical protein [Candidatus Delongbacteria bacterium]
MKQYKLTKKNLEKSIKLISNLCNQKKLNYNDVKIELDIEKDQFYYALYKYFLKDGYLTNEPDDELLLKVSNDEKFRDINLPFEERREFLRFIIQYGNKEFNLSFADQILRINNTDHQFDYFQVQHEISKAIPEMKLCNEALLKILKHFAKLSERDMTVGEVYIACRNFCSNNIEQAWDLLELMIKNNEVTFLAHVLMGISEKEFISAYEKTKDLLKTEYKPQAVFALGFLDYTSKEEIKDAIDLLVAILKNSENDVIIASAKCLTNLLNNRLVIENKYDDEVINLIELILSKKIPDVQYSVLTGLSIYSKKTESGIPLKLLKYYYDIDLKHKGIIRDLGFRLSKLKSPTKIFNFLTNWILNHDDITEIKEFSYALKKGYKENPEGYIKEYLKLIIHNKAIIRNTFKTEFKIVELTKDNTEIWLNSIDKFDKDQKLIFFRTLLDYSIHIKERLSIAFLVLKFLNKELYGIILQEAVWLIHDYAGTVKDVIENTIDKSDTAQVQFLAEFDKLYRIIIKFWETKLKVKELNPKLNQAKYYNKFNEVYFKKQNEYINTYKSDEPSILDTITKVQIGRGRSFRIGDDSVSSEMQEFSVSFVVPRTMYIYPEAYNFIYNKKHNEDWEL